MTKDTVNYYTRKISESNPTQIIVLVYEMTEIYLDEAIMAHKGKDMEGFTAGLSKASKCINDLIEALDMQYEISHQLIDIYMFMNKEISVAMVTYNAESIARIQTMVTKLKTSFEELSAKDTSSAVMGNTQEVYAGLTYGKGSLNESTSIQSNRGFTV